MKQAALVIMAAGMGSRYGGDKQVAGMGPNGEILMEYSIMDAIRAGFTKVVFIIKPGMFELMQRICGEKYAGKIEICYAFQDFSSVPGGAPEGRIKPFGTVHAVLCAKNFVKEPFAVINADDYYGGEAFVGMYEFLTGGRGENCAAMMGYRLENTVSRNGTVTRGICQVEDGTLAHVREVNRVQLMEDGRIVNLDEDEELDPHSPVSMNFWGFGVEVFDMLEREFERFVGAIEDGDLKAEYLLPVFVDEQVGKGRMKVKVLPTKALWFGVTYKEDREEVARALKALHARGLY